jgi:hypothetical protein
MPDSTTLLPCRRPELVARPFGADGSYLIRDRRRGQSFRLTPETYFLLARLDGACTAPELCAAFAEQIGKPLTDADLDRFLDLARTRGLLQPADEKGAGVLCREPSPRGEASFNEYPGFLQSMGNDSRPLRARLFAGVISASAAAVEWLADLFGQGARKLRWGQLRYLEFLPRPDDTFIVTYPRSGTTWMQMILYQLTTDGSMDFPHIFEYCPSFENSIRSVGGFEGRPSPRLFKSHLPYRRLPKGPCRYIYIARNGKDVAVSYFHLHQSHLGYRGTFQEFFDQFMRGKVTRGSWFEHVRDWWRHRDDPNVLFLRYEDLFGDLEGCLRKIIAFCGFEIAPERFPTILARCSFSFMKEHESQFDLLTGMWWEQGRQPNAFLRNGRPGEGKERLTPQQTARFDRAFDEQLGQTGIDFAQKRGQDP